MLSIKRLSALAVAAAMALTVTACSGDSGGSSSDGGSSDSLTLGVVGPVTSFEASESTWANASPFYQAVYDTLLRESPSGELEPWLATDWSYDEAKTVLTMTLRDDVTFTDGTTFDATAAAENVLRFRDGTSPNASALALVADATAVDATTLQITLSAPDPSLLLSLAQNAGLQASPATFDAADAQTNPVGSGPYVLDAANTIVGSSYVFTKNPDYWAPEDQHYETLNLTVLSDTQAALNAIQGGQVDVMPLLDNSGADQIEAAGFNIESAVANGWTGMLLLDRNGQVAPELADVRVRRAIAQAIDRDAILQAAAFGQGEVTGQIFNPANPAYDESLDDTYPYDPEAAQELLAEAGYPDGFTLQMPLIQTGSTVAFDLVAQYLGDVGITVDYTEVPLADSITELLSQKYPATVFILGNYATAWQDANFVLTPAAPFNVFRIEDPQVTSLVSTIQTGSTDEADAAAQQLNQYIVEQAWFVPFFQGVGFIAVSGDTGIEIQSDNVYPYLWNITPTS